MEDGNITIVEDTRESLKDFLDMAQEVESLDGEEQQKKLEEIFGPVDEEESEQETEEDETEEAKSPEEQKREEQIKGRQESRANSDVAMAMMIADKVAAESMAMMIADQENAELMQDNPCYVVHGAKMLCSMGSREARLVVPMDHGILLNKHPQMIADDCASLTNVMCFGNCFSAENHAMEQAAVDATNQYNHKKEGFWAKVKSFFGEKPPTVKSAGKELQQLCICECTPSISADAVWEESNDKSLINDKKTLIQPAVLVCEYGGVIRIIDNGQNN